MALIATASLLFTTYLYCSSITDILYLSRDLLLAALEVNKGLLRLFWRQYVNMQFMPTY
jgi:hypothetical protein